MGLTHAHFDHVLAVPEVVAALGVPVLAHPTDAPVWPHELATLRRDGHWDAGTATGELLTRDPALLTPRTGAPVWDGVTEPLTGGETLHVGPLDVAVLHTPGHTPGGLSLSVDGHLLTGDTLFPGGPGLTGPPMSDAPTILRSVRGLLALPAHTVVHPGHGRDTTVAAERPHLDSWTRGGEQPRPASPSPPADGRPGVAVADLITRRQWDLDAARGAHQRAVPRRWHPPRDRRRARPQPPAGAPAARPARPARRTRPRTAVPRADLLVLRADAVAVHKLSPARASPATQVVQYGTPAGPAQACSFCGKVPHEVPAMAQPTPP